jgi:hypothetical protein
MVRPLQCDLCKKIVEQLAGKIYFVPVDHNGKRRLTHNNYTHHMDICTECKPRVWNAFKFRERVVRKPK